MIKDEAAFNATKNQHKLDIDQLKLQIRKLQFKVDESKVSKREKKSISIQNNEFESLGINPNFNSVTHDKLLFAKSSNVECLQYLPNNQSRIN